MSLYDYTKESTEIFGLKYKPIIYDMNADWLHEAAGGYGAPPEHFTDCDERELINALKWVDGKINTIVEVGVHRPSQSHEKSSTQILIREKDDETIYLGIDTEDRSQILAWGPNVYVLRCDGKAVEDVKYGLSEIGIEELDFVFLDSIHSVNQVLEEWSLYSSLIRTGGVIGFHDINGHPGPYLLFDAIDEEYFEKSGRVCPGTGDDYGVGFVKRIK